MSAAREPPEAEALRARALVALGPAADPRVVALLEAATLAIEPGISSRKHLDDDVACWRVVIGTDARSLGSLAALPAIDDALVEAIGAAFAGFEGCWLDGVAYRWSIDEVPDALGYRGGAARPVDPWETGALERGLVAYLEGADRASAALLARRAQVRRPLAPVARERAAPELVLPGPLAARGEVASRFETDLAAIGGAARALLGVPVRLVRG